MNAFLIERDFAFSGPADAERLTPVHFYIVQIHPDEIGLDDDHEELDEKILTAISHGDDPPPFENYDVEIGTVECKDGQHAVMCEVYPI